MVFCTSAQAGQFEQGMDSLKRGNFAEAYCQWKPLAAQGHPDAAYHLGWLYANGNGLNVDVSKAVYWWTQAANQDHVDAQFALALAYTTGEGIKQQPAEALKWFIQAADAGHEDAREIIREKIQIQDKPILDWLPQLLNRDWIGQSILVNVDEANLRAGPGRKYKILGKITLNTLLIAIDHQHDWYQVINPQDMSYSWIADWLTEAGQQLSP